MKSQRVIYECNNSSFRTHENGLTGGMGISASRQNDDARAIQASTGRAVYLSLRKVAMSDGQAAWWSLLAIPIERFQLPEPDRMGFQINFK